MNIVKFFPAKSDKDLLALVPENEKHLTGKIIKTTPFRKNLNL